MAEAFSKGESGPKKLFSFEIKRIELLSKGTGILSTLDIKKFWIPMRQISLFGIKNQRFMCSISATGLKSHSTLSQVLCLGLFEKIKIQERNRQP